MRYALVTGGSRGIGRAVAVALAKDGYNIIINFRSRQDEAEETLRLVQEAGSNGEFLPFDVANAEESAKAIETWKNTHPGEYIECIVNNAGIRKDNIMALMPVADWHQVVDITLNGFFNVTQPLLQGMIVKKRGRIINMVSLSGLKGLPGQTNYSCAKGGLIAATKALAQEVARKNVTVNAVAPGFIKSDMTADLDEATIKKTIPAGRFGEPSEVADLIAFLASDKAAYINGEVISINGALYT